LHNQPKITRTIRAATLLVVLGLLLTACGAVPTNSWAGLSASPEAVYAAQGFLMAVNPTNGSQLWQYPEKSDTNNQFFAKPAFADGKVYAANFSNVVSAFDAKTGTLLWSYKDHEGKGRIVAAPVVVDSLLLIPSSDHNLYALDLNGVFKWSFKARNSLWGAVVSDGKLIYLPGMDHYLYAINPQTGKLVWEMDLGASMVHTPVLDQDGTLYETTLNQEVLAIDPASHKVLWRQKLDGSVWSEPLLNDGNLYFATDKGKIYGIAAKDGKIVWKADASAAALGTPVLFGKDLAFATESGDVFTISTLGVKGWTRTIKGKLYASPVVSGDRLVVAGQEGDNLLTSFDASGNQSWTFALPK
jgi:eukaryotic-like serine/threonine-protein kinase